MRSILAATLVMLASAGLWTATAQSVPTCEYTISTVAGIFDPNDGVDARLAALDPVAMTVDKSGNVYVADTGNYRIRKLTPTCN